jgi:hypothetical protein
MAGEGEAVRFPFDYAAVNKGDVFTAEWCADLLGGDPQTQRYQLRLLDLSKELERGLWAVGKRYTVRIRQGGLAVLTDAEAAEFNAARFESLERGMTRSHCRMLAVDEGGLSEVQRSRYHRDLALEGLTLAAIAAARAEVRPIPYRRPGPGLPPVPPEGGPPPA